MRRGDCIANRLTSFSRRLSALQHVSEHLLQRSVGFCSLTKLNEHAPPPGVQDACVRALVSSQEILYLSGGSAFCLLEPFSNICQPRMCFSTDSNTFSRLCGSWRKYNQATRNVIKANAILPSRPGFLADAYAFQPCLRHSPYLRHLPRNDEKALFDFATDSTSQTPFLMLVDLDPSSDSCPRFLLAPIFIVSLSPNKPNRLKMSI